MSVKNQSVKMASSGISVVIQTLGLRTSNAEGVGSSPGRGTRTPHAAWHGQKKKKFLFLMASSTFYHPCELDNIQSWEEIIVVTDRLSAEESWPRRVGMIPS